MSIQQRQDVLRFGTFRFNTQQRQLLEENRPLRLGSRALDLLSILIENAGAVVSKETLIKRVWPTTVVEDINLRVHIAAIRRALKDGQNGRRYITNIPQRGYSFVGEVELVRAVADEPPAAVARRRHNLGGRLSPVFGLEKPVQQLVRQIHKRRLVSVIGAGGSGKSTLVHQVGEQLLDDFSDGVFRIDMADLRAPAQLLPLVAETLQLTLPDLHALDALGSLLAERKLLLIFDNADWQVDVCAHLIETLLRATESVHVLVSCREPLLVSGESVYRTAAMALPPTDLPPDAPATAYPAIALFLSQLDGHDRECALSDEGLALVCRICRQCDGLPLGIELAAINTGLLGLTGVLSELENGHALRLSGRRTAEPRHKGLGPCLDWSCALLDTMERQVFLRLALFSEPFTLCRAVRLVSDQYIDESQVFAAITQLVGKSLLSVLLVEHAVQYQLSSTTRLYAMAKLAKDQDYANLQQRFDQVKAAG